MRDTAAAALGRIGPRAAAAVPKLAETVMSSDPALRMEAALALAQLGDVERGEWSVEGLAVRRLTLLRVGGSTHRAGVFGAAGDLPGWQPSVPSPRPGRLGSARSPQ